MLAGYASTWSASTLPSLPSRLTKLVVNTMQKIYTITYYAPLQLSMMSEVNKQEDVTGVEERTEPMETESSNEEGQSAGMMEESGLDLKKTAEEFARYLVVDSKNDVSKIVLKVISLPL